MSIDRDIQAYLDQRAAAGVQPFTRLTVQAARRQDDSQAVEMFGPTDEVAQVNDLTIPGPVGPIPIRVYMPDGLGVRLPVVVNFFGGGFVLGSLTTAHGPCCAFAARGRCVVVSVGYRLAPEHKFPAAVDDAWAAFRWVTEHAPEIGGDSARLAVVGASAGGCLATVVARRAAGAGIRLALQVLIVPATDLATPVANTPAGREDSSRSSGEETRRYFAERYLRSDEDGLNPDASPIRATDLRGVAPALVISAENDFGRPGHEAYAERLRSFGVPVTLAVYPGMVHLFYRMPAVTSVANQALDQIAEALRSAFRVAAE